MAVAELRPKSKALIGGLAVGVDDAAAVAQVLAVRVEHEPVSEGYCRRAGVDGGACLLQAALYVLAGGLALHLPPAGKLSV